MLSAGAEEQDTVIQEARILRRASLHVEAAALVRKEILEGKLTPGLRLNERLLCDQYGISRTPLREAFKVLAAEGLVQLLPNRGAMVAALSLESFNATLSVMAHLEIMIGKGAAEHLSDEDLHLFRIWHHEMFGHFLRQEMIPYFQANQTIHLELARRSGNPILAKIYEGLNTKILRYRYQANLQPERWRAAIEEHETILSALIMRDGPRLGQLLHDHLINKGEAIRRALVANGTAPR